MRPGISFLKAEGRLNQGHGSPRACLTCSHPIFTKGKYHRQCKPKRVCNYCLDPVATPAVIHKSCKKLADALLH